VLVGGVVRDVVEDDLEPEAMGLGDQIAEVLQRPEEGVDVLVVGYVVAEVRHRGGIER
jgi:hypothetical protein